MKMKKLGAIILSAVMTFGAFSVMPGPVTYAEEVLISDGFDVSYDGWCNKGDETALTAVPEAAHNSARGMKVSNRVSEDTGVYAEKGFYLEGGVDYDYSVYVYHNEGNSEKFRLKLTYLYPDGEKYETREIVSKKVDSGEWTKLSGSYRAPKGTVNLTITITTDSTADFYFDDVNVTEKVKSSSNTVSAAETDVGLKDIYANYFRVGTIFNGSTINNSTITAMVLKEFNSITMENEMKPNATLVQSGSTNTNVKVSLNQAAKILDFCSKNNIAVRGHVLVWHGQTPTWFFMDNFTSSGNPVSEAVMEQRLESYIKNMFSTIKTQYPNLNLYAYDVVNEAVSDDASRTSTSSGLNGARPGGFEQGVVAPGSTTGGSPWVYVYGDNGFIERAFTYAAKYRDQYFPNMKLFYNDYNEFWDHKRDCIIRTIVKPLYEKGILDGFGMQSHLSANTDPTAFGGINAYNTALNMYAAIGCEVQLTELDVSTDKGKYTLQQQADRYKSIFQAAINANKKGAGKVTAVVVWGPNDANTWIGSESTPLLFDANTQKKLAYTSVASLVPESEWGDGDNPSGSNTTVEPDENGYYFHDTFEGTLNDWVGRGSATIQTSGRTFYKGAEALLIQGREAAWNGAQKSLNANAFVPGNEYSFSVNAQYFDGNDEETLLLKLQYVDADGETQYSQIASAVAKKGAWVQLANTNYTIPTGAKDMYLYVESAENTMNFYIDEAIGAVAGTVISNPALGLNVSGDVNNDGYINSLDVSAAKKGAFEGFTDTSEKNRADVNGDGSVDSKDIKLIKEFVLGVIKEFPEVVQTVDTAKMEALFSSVTASVSYKSIGNGNPLMTQKFGADPGVMVYGDRVYVYMTNDAFEYKDGAIAENSYNVQTINCLSSADLVNWTDHGSIPVAGSSGAATWANYSWAPAAAHKTINGKEKFFLYFANNAGGIGVLTSDSPTGPWKDPLGKALVTKSTANCSDVTWLFDPAVFVDDDGTGYLYFGGGVPDGRSANPKTARVAKLGADMISIDGTPQTIDAPYLFEDSGINKIGDTYYYSYCTNWSTSGNTLGLSSASIAYMTSSSPMGPFTLQGEFFANPGSFGSEFGSYGNNHHSLIEFKGNYYLFYHSRGLEKSMGLSLNYRSSHVDKVTISNGKIQALKGTMKGTSQLQTLNPYQTVQAENIYRQGGIQVKGVGDTVVTDIQKGDWFGVSDAAFTNGATKVKVKVSSANGAAIKICTGSETGKAVGYVEVPATGGSFVEITAPVSGLSGTQDLYFVFSGPMEVDSWSFS